MRATLAALLVGSPEDHGWARPTWTQELLARQVAHDTGVRVSDSTVGRMLADLGARCGTARPTVACPMGSRAQARRVRAIERRLAALPAREEAFYEDELTEEFHGLFSATPSSPSPGTRCWRRSGSAR